jgi:hypothetical protein
MNVTIQKQENVFFQGQNVPLQSFAYFCNKRKHLENELIYAECSAFHAASRGVFYFRLIKYLG